MKKLTFLFLAVLFLLSGCAEKEAEKNPYRLKTYTAESSIADIPQSSIRCDYFYDENGQVCRWDSYWKGELHRSECPEYDEYGNIIRSTITNSDGTQTVEEHLLTLDEVHRILRDELYVGGSCQEISEYTYDKGGNQTMQTLVRYPKTIEDPSITCRIDRIYDESGNLLREETLWNQGAPARTDYSYADGRLDIVSTYDEHALLTSYTLYTYDETGLTVTMTTYTADGTPEETVVNTYDEYGNLLTNESLNESTERYGKYIYTYELIASADTP